MTILRHKGLQGFTQWDQNSDHAEKFVTQLLEIYGRIQGQVV